MPDGVWAYLPPPNWRSHRDDPIKRLPCGDELAAELAEAIGARLDQGERHIHPKRGGCTVCAAAAADTVVRYLERNTRVIASDALAPDEKERARKTIKSLPYLASGSSLRLTGELAVHPVYPTVDDLLCDLEAIRDRLTVVVERDSDRQRELRTYRSWREAVRELASGIVETFEQIGPDD